MAGRLALAPKSSAVLTMPVPKTWSQKRLTATRAVRGWLGAISHWARPRRLTGAPGGSGGKNAGTARPTLSPRWSYSPLFSRNAGFGSPAFSRKTRVVGIWSSSCFRVLLGLLELQSERFQHRTGLGICVFNEVVAEFVGLGLGSFGPVESDDFLQVLGQACVATGMLGPNPGREGLINLAVLGVSVSMPALSQ